MYTLFAYLVRRADLSHEEFVAHWRNVHGPLIRDTPELARHLLSYRQHVPLPGRRGGSPGYDGMAVQRFENFAAFQAMLDEPEMQKVFEDEKRFLDHEHMRVMFSEDEVTMVDGGR